MKAQGWLGFIYGGLLRLYPRRFREQFALEMQAVFNRLCYQTVGENGWARAILFARELKDLPVSALREHWCEFKENYSMENQTSLSSERPTPGWAVTAIFAFFLVPSLLGFIRLPQATPLFAWLPLIIVALLFFIPLGIGVFNRLPRWSLVYLGVLSGIAGVYVITNILGLLFYALFVGWVDRAIPGEDLASQLLWQWVNQARFWLSIGLASALFLGLAALYPSFRPQLREFRRDLTLFSFLFYGAIVILFVIDFDEYRYDELYQLGSMACLALGAWGYLRAKTPGRRTLALLAGLTGCMLIMGVGKYFLVPLQDWGEWFDATAKEGQRVFESLRTIATWFWCAVAVGLPGLIQSLRKPPETVAQIEPQPA